MFLVDRFSYIPQSFLHQSNHSDPGFRVIPICRGHVIRQRCGTSSQEARHAMKMYEAYESSECLATISCPHGNILILKYLESFMRILSSLSIFARGSSSWCRFLDGIQTQAEGSKGDCWDGMHVISSCVPVTIGPKKRM